MANGPVPGPALVHRIADALSGVWSIISIIIALITLVVWVVRQEGRIIALEKDVQAENRRLDDFDTRGTRALSDRVAQLNQLGALLNSHVNTVDSRDSQMIADLEKRLRAQEDMRRQIDVLVSRQEEGYRKYGVLEQRIDSFSREFNRAMDALSRRDGHETPP